MIIMNIMTMILLKLELKIKYMDGIIYNGRNTLILEDILI